MSEGDLKRCKKDIFVPIDLQVTLLSLADDIKTLFDAGKVHRKVLLKQYDLFGKWFRAHCRVPDMDAAVREFFTHFYCVTHYMAGYLVNPNPDLDSEVGIYVRHDRVYLNVDEEYFNVVGGLLGAGWIPLLDRYMFMTDFPVFVALELVHLIKSRFPELDFEHNASKKPVASFSHRQPVDVLALVMLPLHLSRLENDCEDLSSSLERHLNALARESSGEVYPFFHFLRTMVQAGLLSVKEVLE